MQRRFEVNGEKSLNFTNFKKNGNDIEKNLYTFVFILNANGLIFRDGWILQQ